MKIRFKLIPFLISTLIVVGITFGICWYSYHGYEGNKLKYLDEHFHVDDYEKYNTSELIKNFVEMQFSKYAKGTEKVSIINPTTGEKITSSSEDANILSFNNGTIHVPGYFDIDVYATASWLDDEWVYNYYFYYYNINYQNSKFNPSNLEMIVVDGMGRSNSDGEDDEKLGLDLLDNAYLKKYDDDENNNPSTTLGYVTSFSYTGDAGVTASYPIRDNGFINDENRDENTNHLVFNMAPRTDINHNSITNPVDSNGNPIQTTGNVSFTLVDTTDDKNVRLFTGAIEDVTSMDELSYETGCQKNPMNSKNYGIVVAGKVILHGAIAFVLSGVVAFLFYLIWMDPADKTSTQNKKQITKGNSKKK